MGALLALSLFGLAGGYSGGDGSAENPYEIGTVADWQHFMVTTADWVQRHFILTGNIDLNGISLTPVGNSINKPFNGVIDGNGHTISNVVIDTPNSSYVGLFGCLGNNGQIKNLGVENVQVSGCDYVGGLVGLVSDGTISKCSSTGTVAGIYYVGGLAGCAVGSLSNCFTAVSVSGVYTVGGLVGNAGGINSTIVACSAEGTVSGAGIYIGGLAGNSHSTAISASSFSGEVNAASESRSIGGLTGYLNNGSLVDCHVTGSIYTATSSRYVGGLAGECLDSAITHCSYDGTITAFNSLYIGGIAGKISGDYGRSTISNCSTTGPVIGDHSNSVGGLAGFFGSGAIIRCNSASEVSGGSWVGGLVGRISRYMGNDPVLSNSFATGSVCGDFSVGGLAGSIYSGTIVNCYATGSVRGTEEVGGLAGINDQGTIAYCYSTGKRTGSTYVGGLCWRITSNTGDMKAYNFWDTETSEITVSSMGTGKTTAEMQTLATFFDSGWLFVHGGRTIGNWVMPEGGTPKLAQEIYRAIVIPDVKRMTEAEAAAAIAGAGLLVGETCFVYDGTIEAGKVSQTSPKVGTVGYEGLTPVHILLAKRTRYAGGDGITEPYEIRDLGNWIDAVNSPADWGRRFILTADINLASQVYTQAPIAYCMHPNAYTYQGTPFTGDFDGNGHSLANLTISASDRNFIGLFGSLGPGGQVRNLSIENAQIRGVWYAGILAGYIHTGTISNCSVNGSAIGEKMIGGLAGHNLSGVITRCHANVTVKSIISDSGGLVGLTKYGTITECYVTGSIGSFYWVGGLTGYSESGAMLNCYATGSVQGSYFVGGLTGGNNSGTLLNCYATGSVQGSSEVGGLIGANEALSYAGYLVVTSCFWDVQSSGQNNGIGQGISGGVMGKTTGEMRMLSTFVEAGWDFGSVWAICEGMNTPRLQWQIPTADWVCPDGVGVEDLGYFAMRWLMADCGDSGGCEGGDLDGDGTVGLADWAVLAGQWMAE
jgi:hypothetical protein